jgi:hypothetical protein
MEILKTIGDTLSAPRRYLWSALGLPEHGNELVSNITGMDPSSFGANALGFGAEVLADPLTYAGAALGAAGKLGRVGKAMYGGQLDDLAHSINLKQINMPALEGQINSAQKVFDDTYRPFFDPMQATLTGTRADRPFDLVGIARGKTGTATVPEYIANFMNERNLLTPNNLPIFSQTGTDPVEIMFRGRQRMYPRPVVYSNYHNMWDEVNGKISQNQVDVIRQNMGLYPMHTVWRNSPLNRSYIDQARIGEMIPGTPRLTPDDLAYLQSIGNSKLYSRTTQNSLAHDLAVEKIRRHANFDKSNIPVDDYGEIIGVVPSKYIKDTVNQLDMHGYPNINAADDYTPMIQNVTAGSLNQFRPGDGSILGSYLNDLIQKFNLPAGSNPRSILRSFRDTIPIEQGLASNLASTINTYDRGGGALLGALASLGLPRFGPTVGTTYE